MKGARESKRCKKPAFIHSPLGTDYEYISTVSVSEGDRVLESWKSEFKSGFRGAAMFVIVFQS